MKGTRDDAGAYGYGVDAVSGPSSIFSRATRGTRMRPPIRMDGISPRSTAEYAEVFEMPKALAASATDIVNLGSAIDG